MSYIVKRKVKDSIYVYEATSYRNKEGKPRNKQRYLGKLDDDGLIITKKRKLPAQIKEYKTVTRKIVLVPYKKRVKKTDTLIPTASGSTGNPSTDDNTADNGESTTDASTL